MQGKIKIILVRIFLIWLAGVLVTCVLVPFFQKSAPEFPGHTPSPEMEGVPQERVLCIDDNMEALTRRIQMIESAQEEIELATYYLEDDDSGRDVMAALWAASQRGVRVRVLVDGLCAFSGLEKSKVFRSIASAENVEIRIYNPVNILFPGKINYRMHDKYLIVDDQIFLMGGRNTHNVSLGDYPGKRDIDRDLLVYCENGNGTISQLRDYFEAVWELSVSKPFHPGNQDHSDGDQLLEQRYETHIKCGFQETDFRAITMPVTRVTLLTNPIAAKNKSPVLWTALMKILEQGSDIEVQTPYIICNHQMYRDLSGLNTGDRVLRVITNAAECGANPCGCADLLNHKDRVLKTGIELYEYVGERSAHTKTILIDEDLSLVGSFNFDMRSTYLDTEMMLLVESPELNAQLRSVNDKYIQSSRKTESDGTQILGESCEIPEMSLPKRVLYGLLRAIILPIRHLL